MVLVKGTALTAQVGSGMGTFGWVSEGWQRSDKLGSEVAGADPAVHEVWVYDSAG